MSNLCSFQPDVKLDYNLEDDGVDEAEQAALLEDLKSECKEMAMTTFFVERPCCCLTIGYCTLLLLTFITIQSGLVALSDFTSRDYLVWSDKIVLDNDLLSVAKTELSASSGASENRTEQIKPI